MTDERFLVRTLGRLERERPTTVPAPKVGIILAGWDSAPVERAMRDVDIWLERRHLTASRVLVANRRSALVERSLWTIVQGSNIAGEFSAYDEGVAALRGANVDVLLVMNDRYDSYPGLSLDRIGAQLLNLVYRERVMVGRFEPQVVAPTPEAVQHGYIQSHFFAIAHEALDHLHSFVRWSFEDRHRLFCPGWPVAAPKDQPEGIFTSAYLEFLASWLTGTGSIRKSWYRASTAIESVPGLQRKATSIANEHAVSERLATAGYVLLDGEWALRAANLSLRGPLLTRWLARIQRHTPSIDSRASRAWLIWLSVLSRSGCVLRPRDCSQARACSEQHRGGA